MVDGEHMLVPSLWEEGISKSHSSRPWHVLTKWKEEGCLLTEHSQLITSMQVEKGLSLGFILEIRNPNPSYQA